MAKMSYEKAQKLTAGCGNDFRLDVFGTLSNGSNQFEKSIPLDNGKLLSVLISFVERYNHEEGRRINMPMMWMNESHKEGSFIVSHGLGYNHRLDNEEHKRKNTKVLQEHTKHLTDEVILDIFNSKRKTERNMLA